MRNQQNFRLDSNAGNSGFFHGFDPYDLRSKRKSLNDEMEELLHTVYINSLEENNNNKSNEVPTDDSTIFLTFSTK